MGDFLIIERDGPIATVTLNRPQERNAISRPEYIQEIKDFCAAATADMSLKAVIVTGAGTAFCAGGNIKDMRDKAGIFEGFTSCTASNKGLSAEALLKQIMDAPIVRCDAVQWEWLGVSMAGWNGIVSVGGALVILWLSLGKGRA